MMIRDKLKLMPLLVLVASLAFGVRFGEFISGVSENPGRANAQTSTVLPSPPDLQESKEDVQSQIETIPVPPSISEDEPRTASIAEDQEKQAEDNQDWRDSSDEDFESSSMRMELFQDLSARREALKNRERELSVREALLKAAEQEIDQKYKELVSIRSEIKDLLVQQSEEEEQRTASLVKIYEGMKPKDAARIFNTLDMDILLSVVSRMSERKSAPIIAAMNPDRARALTTMLMEQKALPVSNTNLITQ